MADAIAMYVDEHELGRPERRIAVRGKLDVGNETRAKAALVLTPRGVYLVAAAGSGQGLAIDLLARSDLRWESGPLGDGLRLGEIRLGFAPGKASAARELIGLGRLRRGVARPDPELYDLCHVEAPSALERAFLACYLEADEILLAWLHSATSLPVHSDLLGEAQAEIRFCVTERRHALIALTEAGDVREVPLDDAPLSFEKSLGRARLSSGGQTWQSTLGNADRYHQLAALLGERGALRLREAARLNFAGRAIDARFAASASRLLERAHAGGDLLADWAGLFLAQHGGSAAPSRRVLEALLDATKRAALDADALGKLGESWGFHPTTARRMLDALRALGPASEPWALGLHRSLHALEVGDSGPFDRARADIALAEHLLATGRAEETKGLLESRLREMPSEALEELLPPSDADLTRGAGGQALTIRIHELLALARGAGQRGDARTLAVLARLQPLLLPRLRALADAASDDLGTRARRTLDVLQPNGLHAPCSGNGGAPLLAPLSEHSIERRLCHPLVREGGVLLGRFQALLAAVPSPDHGVLRDYCEVLALERHPDAARALSDAARAFGVEGLLAYVSRGKMSVGLRAYEGSPPFILIGVRHLEGDAEYAMTAEELRFAIGAEVAHLRYGHTRVTSSEVWAGALSKSKQGLDMALGMLPMLKGWRFADKVSRIVSRMPIDTVRRALDGGGLIGGRLRSGLGLLPTPRDDNEGVLSRINEELVAAHRVMQLTADRAGLLMAGDLCAAIRGLLLLRRDHRQVMGEAMQDGLDSALARRDTSGAIAHQDLAVRVAALIAFYLSDDYVTLRAELGA